MPDDDVVVARFDAVSFAYDPARPILRALDLAVRRGRVLALLGPNGSGKTTVLSLLAGALAPDAGTVAVRERVGLVPQRAEVAFAYSVLDVVVMGRARHVGLFSTPSARDEAAALAALNRVGLGPLAARALDTLSGGERQLVLLARALASDARLLVLDEPTAALDLAHQQLVLGQLRRLARRDGAAVVFSTHQPEHAAALADDVVLLARDGAAAAGSARAMLTTERLRALFGVTVRRVAVGADGREALVPLWELSDDGTAL